MKIGISSTGSTLESPMDQRFGRAMYFIILDLESMAFEAIDNQGALSAGGAGITSAQAMVDKGVSAVITGNVGPNAMKVLDAAGIEVYRGAQVSVRENFEDFKKGSLDRIGATVPQHFGLGYRGGNR